MRDGLRVFCKEIGVEKQSSDEEYVGPVLAQPAAYVGLDPCASYPAPDTSRADAASRMALALDTSRHADASSPDGAGAD